MLSRSSEVPVGDPKNLRKFWCRFFESPIGISREQLGTRLLVKVEMAKTGFFGVFWGPLIESKKHEMYKQTAWLYDTMKN